MTTARDSAWEDLGGRRVIDLSEARRRRDDRERIRELIAAARAAIAAARERQDRGA